MHDTDINQSILVITGMHRSGTSFAASLLQSAGLDIGHRLVEPAHGNVRGFFENRDFLEFHEMVLDSQGLNNVGWILEETIDVQEQHVKKAKEITAKNSRSTMWGWKEPRTTLFLDFWANLLPSANFLLIYRAPWEVVDSLYRRGDDIFVEQPELAVEVWMHYNKKILDFYDEFPERCFLVSIYSIANKTELLINAINADFKLNLASPKSDIYEQSLFHTQASDIHRQGLISHYFPQALDIYQELNKREVLSDRSLELLQLKHIETSYDKVWAFKDWRKLRNLEGQVKSLQSALERSQLQLQKIQAELQMPLNANTDSAEED